MHIKILKYATASQSKFKVKLIAEYEGDIAPKVGEEICVGDWLVQDSYHKVIRVSHYIPNDGTPNAIVAYLNVYICGAN